MFFLFIFIVYFLINASITKLKFKKLKNFFDRAYKAFKTIKRFASTLCYLKKNNKKKIRKKKLNIKNKNKNLFKQKFIQFIRN